MTYFIKIWLAGWLVMVAWYLFSTLIFFRSKKPESRSQFVRSNALEALYCIILWPLAMFMLVFLGLLNRKSKQ